MSTNYGTISNFYSTTANPWSYQGCSPGCFVQSVEVFLSTDNTMIAMYRGIIITCTDGEKKALIGTKGSTSQTGASANGFNIMKGSTAAYNGSYLVMGNSVSGTYTRFGCNPADALCQATGETSFSCADGSVMFGLAARWSSFWVDGVFAYCGYVVCPTGYTRQGIQCASCVQCLANQYAYGCSPGTGVCTACGTCASGQRYIQCSSILSFDNHTCVTCSPGTYSVGGYVDTCTDCPSGWYGSMAGMSVCSQCPAGKFSAMGGLTECSACPAGQSSTAGSNACRPCAANTYSASAGALCTGCPAGKSSLAGATDCSMCSGGTYGAGVGSGCVLCPLGKYNNNPGAVSCSLCSAGYYSGQTGAFVCSSCSAGSFTGSTGLSACTAAIRGAYVAATAATAQTPCPTGTFSDTPGLTACPQCAAGTYTILTGRSVCTSCQSGQDSLSGASVCTQCTAATPNSRLTGVRGTGVLCPYVCVSGYYLAGSMCPKCPIGTYSSAGQNTCTFCTNPIPVTFAYSDSATNNSCPTLFCAAGYGSDGAGGCRQCPQNFYSQADGAGCKACAPGMANECLNAPAGSSACSYPCCFGFWRDPDTQQCVDNTKTVSRAGTRTTTGPLQTSPYTQQNSKPTTSGAALITSTVPFRNYTDTTVDTMAQFATSSNTAPRTGTPPPPPAMNAYVRFQIAMARDDYVSEVNEELRISMAIFFGLDPRQVSILLLQGRRLLAGTAYLGMQLGVPDGNQAAALAQRVIIEGPLFSNFVVTERLLPAARILIETLTLDMGTPAPAPATTAADAQKVGSSTNAAATITSSSRTTAPPAPPPSPPAPAPPPSPSAPAPPPSPPAPAPPPSPGSSDAGRAAPPRGWLRAGIAALILVRRRG